MGLADNIAKWNSTFDSLAQSGANRPYLEDIARANRDSLVGKSMTNMAEGNNAPQYYKGQAQNAENTAGLSGLRLQYAPTEFGQKTQLNNLHMQKLGEDLKYSPLKHLLEATKAQQQTSRFGKAYQLRTALANMPPAARDTWIAQNIDQYNDMLTTFANEQKEGNKGNDLVNNMVNKLFPSEDLTINEAGQKVLLDSGIAKPKNKEIPLVIEQQIPQTLPVNEKMKGMFQPPTELKNDQLRRSLELSANKTLTTPKTMNQLEGGVQLLSILEDPAFLEKAQKASEYAGATNKTKEYYDRWFGDENSAVNDYISFKDHDIPEILNRFKGLEAMGSTDAQRQELHNMYKALDSASSDPKRFMKQLKLFADSVRRVDAAVKKSANPVFSTERSRPESYDKKTQLEDPLGLR